MLPFNWFDSYYADQRKRILKFCIWLSALLILMITISITLHQILIRQYFQQNARQMQLLQTIARDNSFTVSTQSSASLHKKTSLLSLINEILAQIPDTAWISELSICLDRITLKGGGVYSNKAPQFIYQIIKSLGPRRTYRIQLDGHNQFALTSDII